MGGAENGLKLRRGRISLERKNEIVEQYDLLSKPCSDADAAAIFGITKATLEKILSERKEINKAVAIKHETPSSIDVDDSEGGSVSSPKLKRGRLSYEKQKELLAHYDQLPKCSSSEAASKLGIKEATLTKLLASRRKIFSGLRKRKKVEVDSSSESDNHVTPNRVQIQSSARLRRGPLSTERQKELLAQYDKIRKPLTHQAAAAELGISQAALTKLLSSRGASTARLSPQPGGSGIKTATRRSPQPGTSGINMTLRKGRRVRVDFSEDEQSDSDYKENRSDVTDDGDAELEDGTWEVKPTRKKKRYSLAEKQKLLTKYDELTPCPQLRAAQILGITQSTLSIWLHQRDITATNSKASQSKRDTVKLEEDDDSSCSGEEIDCYVMGSSNGTQVVQFFEVNLEEGDKKSEESTGDDSNTFTRKPHMTLREKFEIYKTYDSMDPNSQRNAAATFNLNKSTWFNLITNRYYYEQRFKTRLCKDMSILNKYDKLENKRGAAKSLAVPNSKLNKLLANRKTIEKYFTELFGCNEDGESIALSVDDTESPWKDSKALSALEVQLLQWFKQANSEKVVNWKILKEKAKELAVKSGMDDFHPSDAWLRKWNKTNRVFWSKKGKLVTIYGSGENRSVSECVLTALKDFPPENVFNLVETGLYYRAVPGSSAVIKDWVTVAFACNMSGTEKKKLLVVGKSKAPRSFRVMALPLVYKYSRQRCMTEEIVCDFLQDWDRELVETNRKVAVVLDSSSSHPNFQLSQIRMFFVPTDCSEGQPLNDGIVGYAKALYRKRMAESLQRANGTGDCAAEEFTIVDALFALAEAWEKVPKPLLVSKFLNSAFPQNGIGEPDKDDLDDEELERLNKLDAEIRLHSASDGLPCLKFSDEEIGELDGGHVVHMEGTVNLTDEEEDDFDIDSLLHNQDPPDYSPDPSNCAQNSSPGSDSKVKNLKKTSTPNGSLITDPKDCGLPTVSDVRNALATIKKFLQLNGGTLEDLTDYTQLESKVLSKIKNPSAPSKPS